MWPCTAASHFKLKHSLLQVLTGKFNTFAKAAAKGELPKSSPLHRAAAFDLDILQKLAVAETTLVSWVEDVSRSLPEGWATAGTSHLLLCCFDR